MFDRIGEVVYYDKLIDQVIILESDVTTLTALVIAMFRSDQLEYIGTLGE